MEVGVRYGCPPARAKRASREDPYLKENGNLSMSEKFGSKLSCSWTVATRAILVKLAKMAKTVI